MIANFRYLKGCHIEEKVEFFSIYLEDKTEQIENRLEIRINYSSCQLVEHSAT